MSPARTYTRVKTHAYRDGQHLGGLGGFDPFAAAAEHFAIELVVPLTAPASRKR